MAKILLLGMYPILSQRYAQDERFVVYENDRFEYWVDHQQQSMVVPNTLSDLNCLDQLALIRRKLSFWEPIWNRWIGEAAQYELFRHEALLKVQNLVHQLRALNIRNAIFFSSITHHVEYALLEVACQVAGVKQIHLYGSLFGSNGRLVPMVQHQSIQDRQILGHVISTRDLKEDVLAFRDRYLSHKPPAHNEKPNRKTLSFAYAMYKIYVHGLKRSMKQGLQVVLGNKAFQVDPYLYYSPSTFRALLFQQRAALAYYKQTCQTALHVQTLLSQHNQLPIIFAHYQPEATTFPEGDQFSNHVDVVLEIRRLGYRGPILYKEHPASWLYYSDITGVSRVGMYRSISYYKQLQALGCVFVDLSFKLTKEYESTLFPITITGTIALERSLVGLKTCCAGQPWFKGAPGIGDLCSTFGSGGFFYDTKNWRFNSQDSVDWFAGKLSKRTLNNCVGIATGVVSNNPQDQQEFMQEFEQLIVSLDQHENQCFVEQEKNLEQQFVSNCYA